MDAALWSATKARLEARGLWGAGASLSLRVAGDETMWLGDEHDAAPRLLRLAEAAEASIHRAVYAARADVGAVAVGGGKFGRVLAAFGGRMPVLFDEQARHLGIMGEASAAPADLAAALRRGANAMLVAGLPVVLGMTAKRLALNAELFEKCVTAYVLARAAGGPIHAPACWARAIAGRRLRRDERRAAERFAQGLPPQDNDRY
jgi:ribulose-5-phosphate 4-epimerase/fuculose-1-phosphate aldolase